MGCRGQCPYLGRDVASAWLRLGLVKDLPGITMKPLPLFCGILVSSDLGLAGHYVPGFQGESPPQRKGQCQFSGAHDECLGRTSGEAGQEGQVGHLCA